MNLGRGARLGLLRQAHDFRLLFFATLASSLGTWLAFVAIVIDVFDRTGDANWVSALLIVEFLPIVLIGLVAGPLIDRLPRRRILVVADVARALVFALLPFAGGALQIVLLAAAAGVATSFFRPAAYAGLPNIVSEDELPQANGLLQAAESLTWAAGSLVGGVLVAASGPELAYWLNSASFVASAALLLRIRTSLEEEREPAEGHLSELAKGITLIRRSLPLMTVLVVWSIVMLAFAGINVAEVVLAKDVLDAGDFGYGLLVGAASLGLFLGSLLGADWIAERGPRVPYAVSIGIAGGGFGAAALAPNVWVAAALVVVAGFGNGVAVICNVQLIQGGAPDRLRGRAFTAIMSISYAFLGLGMIIAGPLTNAFGARAVWGLGAGLCGVAALVGFLLLRRAGAEAPAGGTSEAVPDEPYPASEPQRAL